MDRLRRNPHLSFGLITVLALAWAAPTGAQESEAPASGLYDRPVLALDPGMHTSPIKRADVDASGRYAVTGSDDKTVRVWSVADGRLLQTIRVPAGPGNIGKIYAVAISPDGSLIAAGGWTGPNGVNDNIFLFDRETGSLVQRIDGLPNVVLHLTFSPDGRVLAATLYGGNGLRVYGRDQGWAEIASDSIYRDHSLWADFAPDGRLATISFDGQIRLYEPSFELILQIEAPGGAEPYGLAFSPDGQKLAVGYNDSAAVDLLDSRRLELLASLDTAGIDNGNLFVVAWSQDGAILFAGGRYSRGGRNPIVAWSDGGLGDRREISASTDTIMTLAPLADGQLLIAGQDPYLGLLDDAGEVLWVQGPRNAYYRHDRLSVSPDGGVIDFSYESWGKIPARFDLRALALSLDPPGDDLTMAPIQEGLKITGWKNTRAPMLNGETLPLKRYEISRSFAIHPDHDRFVLGTEWYLRAFEAAGEQLWQVAAPGIVWVVNINGDGRLVVAAYGDGTIRWHDIEDGRELLAFFPLADQKDWVAWTPDGFYASTPGARSVLRWHVNHGWDQAAEAVPASDIPELHRPNVLPLVLQELDIARALGLVELAEGTGSNKAPPQHGHRSGRPAPRAHDRRWRLQPRAGRPSPPRVCR